MENVLLNGFDDANPASDNETIPLRINVKLADLGSSKKTPPSLPTVHTNCNDNVSYKVMAPNRGEVTSITYRSPEVYFHKAWTRAIDIWAWGIAVSSMEYIPKKTYHNIVWNEGVYPE